MLGKKTVFGEAITADPAGNYNTALLHLHRGTASFCAVQLLTQWNVPNIISKKLLHNKWNMVSISTLVLHNNASMHAAASCPTLQSKCTLFFGGGGGGGV